MSKVSQELAVGLEPTNLEFTKFALYQLSYASGSRNVGGYRRESNPMLPTEKAIYR